MKSKYDICIIGAGAAGLSAAGMIKKKSVVVLDKNKKPGTKLYATGNGRCNLANAVISYSDYYGNMFPFEVFNESEKLFKELNLFSCKKTNYSPSDIVKAFFLSIGVAISEKNEYMYPVSNQASSVVWALIDYAVSNGALIKEKCDVNKIIFDKEKNQYNIVTSDSSFYAKKILLACGSPAAPDLGASEPDKIYALMNDLNISFREFEPALCPIKCEGNFGDIAGERINVTIFVEEDNNRISEKGQLQITEYGISGIVVFNISVKVKPESKIHIDLIPDKSDEVIFHNIRKINVRRSVLGVFTSYLPDKLAKFMIKQKSSFDLNDCIQDISDNDLLMFIHGVKDWTVTAVEKLTFERSQASDGGISTYEINPCSMHLNRTSGVYAAGEIIDSIGKCGGYNLMFSFCSGINAGIHMDIDN